MHRVRSLYSFTVDGFKIEQLNEWIIKLAGIDILSIVIVLLVFPVLFLKQLFDINANYEKLINKIKSLERQNNENKKNVHTETETVELRAEVTTSLH